MKESISIPIPWEILLGIFFRMKLSLDAEFFRCRASLFLTMDKL